MHLILCIAFNKQENLVHLHVPKFAITKFASTQVARPWPVSHDGGKYTGTGTGTGNAVSSRMPYNFLVRLAVQSGSDRPANGRKSNSG
jgi:hypothetical protein